MSKGKTLESRVRSLVLQVERAVNQLLLVNDGDEMERGSDKEYISNLLKLLQLMEKLHDVLEKWKVGKGEEEVPINYAVIRKYLEKISL